MIACIKRRRSPLSAVITRLGASTTQAVLGQAKVGDGDHLSTRERSRLNGQMRKMRERTKHYVLEETPVKPSETVAVRRYYPSDPRFRQAGQTLADYLELMIACKHGNTRNIFTASVVND